MIDKRYFLCILSALLVMSSLSCGKSDALRGSKVERAEVESAGQLPAGIPAPKFSVKTSSGQTRTLESYQGKPLLIIFWATWCGNCMRELPSLSYMREQVGEDKLAMLAINLGERPTTVRQFLNKVPLPYEIGIDPEQLTADQFGVQAIPMMILINPSGNIVSIDYGLTAPIVGMIKKMTAA